jgi:hypothetical protein
MNFDYNTSRKKLILPEYGRHIHLMVQHAAAIEDREERNRAAHAIIGIMGNLNPHLRDVNDFKHKLWDHLAIMSEFKLDIDSPYPPPSHEKLEEKPLPVAYPQATIRKKHYGKIVIDMLHHACSLPEGTLRDYLIQLLAIQMRKSFLLWNRDLNGDEVIIQDMHELSGGKIPLSTTITLKVPEVKEFYHIKNRRLNKKGPRK